MNKIKIKYESEKLLPNVRRPTRVILRHRNDRNVVYLNTITIQYLRLGKTIFWWFRPRAKWRRSIRLDEFLVFRSSRKKYLTDVWFFVAAINIWTRFRSTNFTANIRLCTIWTAITTTITTGIFKNKYFYNYICTIFYKFGKLELTETLRVFKYLLTYLKQNCIFSSL